MLQLIQGGKPEADPLIDVDYAGAVVLLGRQFVVLVRPLNGRDEWLLPKGHVEDGESLTDAALREAKEETGAECALEDPQPIAVTVQEDEKERKTTTWFLLRAGAIKTENSEVLPLKVESQLGDSRRHIGIYPVLVALTRLTYPDHREVLCKVLSGA